MTITPDEEKCGAWAAGILVLLSIGAMVAAVLAIAYIGDGQPNPRGGVRW